MAQMNADAAERIAIEALAFFAGDPERLAGFLEATGLSPQNLRQAARDPRFLAAVLDHLQREDAAILAFAANSGHAPETIAAAAARLAPRHERDLP